MLNLDSNVTIQLSNVEFIENKLWNDSTPELEPINDLSYDLTPSTSSHEKKESDTQFEPRRSQRDRKEKSLSLDFISSKSLTFLLKEICIYCNQ